MILKQLRLSRHLSQEQLALMSGLNVRTIQRIENGHKASIESLKCLASVLEVDISTLNQEIFMIDKNSDSWRNLPYWLKCWFAFNFMNVRPTRTIAIRIELFFYVGGFILCVLGNFNVAALAAGLNFLAIAIIFRLLTLQGDKFGVWYERHGDPLDCN